MEVCAHLDGCLDADLLLVHPDNFDIEEVATTARLAFKRVTTATYPDWHGDSTWPKPQNWAWQRVAKLIASTIRTKHTGWLWWEADACPLRAGWLATLSNTYRSKRRLFAGVHCTSPSGNFYMNGVGVYPFDIINALSNTSALYDAQQPFDIAAGNSVRASFADFSTLMLHARKLRGGDPGSGFDPTTLALTLKRHPSAVFYHGCDSTLPLTILGRDLPTTPTFTTSSKPLYAPLTQQHPTWPSGIFTFPTTFTPTVYYNASIARFQGDLLLLTRRHRFFTTPHAPDSNTSDLAIFRIHPNMTLDPACIVPRAPSRHPLEQWEDPRAVVADSNLHVSFATWIHGHDWAIRQALCYVTPTLSRFDVLLEPDYGGNHHAPHMATAHNKNWLFFVHDGAWHFVYTTAPRHVVVRLDRDGTVADEHVSPLDASAYADIYGLPRGGTPPILHDDRYYTFFHSSVPDKTWRRRYFMGALAFDAHPPFKPLAMTTVPLLAASEADVNCLNSPLVVFPNGAILEDGHFIVTYGINDEGSGWIKILHEELLTRLTPL